MVKDRDWRFGGALETYRERVGEQGLSEYTAMLERLSAKGKLGRRGWMNYGDWLQTAKQNTLAA